MFLAPALPEEALEADEPVLPVRPVGGGAVGDDVRDVLVDPISIFNLGFSLNAGMPLAKSKIREKWQFLSFYQN